MSRPGRVRRGGSRATGAGTMRSWSGPVLCGSRGQVQKGMMPNGCAPCRPPASRARVAAVPQTRLTGSRFPNSCRVLTQPELWITAGSPRGIHRIPFTPAAALDNMPRSAVGQQPPLGGRALGARALGGRPLGARASGAAQCLVSPAAQARNCDRRLTRRGGGMPDGRRTLQRPRRLTLAWPVSAAEVSR